MPAERTIVSKSSDGFAVYYSDGTLYLRSITASFPFVTKARPGQLDKKTGQMSSPSFQCIGILPIATHAAAIRFIRDDIIVGILKEHNKGEGIKADRKFIRKGEDEEKAEYKGAWIVSAREQESHPPKALRPNKTPLKHGEVVEIAGGGKVRLEGGCKINMLIRPWWQNSESYGKRVNAGLSAVQLLPQVYVPFADSTVSDEAIQDTFEDLEGEGGGWEADIGDL
jgi:hypothetical protein